MSLAREADLDLMSATDDVDETVSEFVGEFEQLEDEDFEALGIDPWRSTGAKPGSEDKVLMLAARYAAGLPLWHSEDCYDHGPKRTSVPTSDDEELLDYLMLSDEEE